LPEHREQKTLGFIGTLAQRKRERHDMKIKMFPRSLPSPGKLKKKCFVTSNPGTKLASTLQY